MKAITIQVPKETTVKELLLESELDPKMYIVSKNDELVKLDDKLKEGESVKVIPAVAGG